LKGSGGLMEEHLIVVILLTANEMNYRGFLPLGSYSDCKAGVFLMCSYLNFIIGIDCCSASNTIVFEQM
jgi:hypothetical protein